MTCRELAVLLIKGGDIDQTVEIELPYRPSIGIWFLQVSKDKTKVLLVPEEEIYDDVTEPIAPEEHRSSG